ncbi:MAG TPA: Gfo/Idh/MocA family oxidoreductase [Pirellulales bacterium]|nr:Gfo/Idh/MocA family oxidoreductase [Pirellulales bacterium]
MAKLQIVVAGVGLMGRRHIELIKANPSCELAAIIDPATHAAEVAGRVGVRLYRSLEDLFRSAHPDGVILATPNAIHLDGVLACIQAGVPTLVEKPLAGTLEEGERICEAAERAGAKILVGHHRRYNPILLRARQIVEQGTLGRLVAVQGSAVFYKPDEYFDEAPWRRQPGGGPILINLIHEIDSLRCVCGEIASVQAMTSNATRRFPVEDTAAINLRFASGALGTFLLSDTAASSKSWEQTSRENPAYSADADDDCYLIAGTDGSLGVPTMRLKIYARREDRSWWKPFQATIVEVEYASPLERQLDHFCAVIRGETPPLVTAQDALQNLRVAAAIVKAASSGNTAIIS